MCKTRLLLLMMMALLIASSLIGCAGPAARVGVEFCDHARPIWFDTVEQVDATPAAVRRQILDGNETIKRLCR
ncbi:hypothetical protein [Bordetella bronchiseptica]|uniref:hypothetical protein n=1 Tax=Bordetella bronchiseptica TaxID=518 RepID=UPI00030297F0|nr:hypothetical protein [Bordetella bronchiseptica]KAK69075.1 putative lipoprotein [Bordetella bronchiseptica 980-2]KDD52246.1 putative lipoprotein [Bordetella bronchiseptica OSU553]KCV53245.1 putative lipoprotein [Bordetella bronchiseptica 3E44]KCV59683.1 putative lipoprotein [Bordetella bronchiseptica 980]KDB58378.1 putative lipoprotein [Bordetella bronchiseptica A1-7]